MKGKIVLTRHGETKWNVTRQHTSFTDLELTENGINQAKKLHASLQKFRFAKIYSSPMRRSLQTCEIAGFSNPIIEEKLTEWNYGNFEGKTSKEIREKIHNWSIFTHGADGGECISDVEKRAKAFLASLKNIEADILLFSHGHFSRVLGAVWIGMDPSLGKALYLSNATISILGFDRNTKVIQSWNCSA